MTIEECVEAIKQEHQDEYDCRDYNTGLDGAIVAIRDMDKGLKMDEELKLTRIDALTEALSKTKDEWTQTFLKNTIERLKRSDK